MASKDLIAEVRAKDRKALRSLVQALEDQGIDTFLLSREAISENYGPIEIFVGTGSAIGAAADVILSQCQSSIETYATSSNDPASPGNGWGSNNRYLIRYQGSRFTIYCGDPLNKSNGSKPGNGA